MNEADIRRFLADAFPQVFGTQPVTIYAAEAGRATLTLLPDERHLRPGGIVSGPTLMMLADAAAYAALLSLGDARMAVTTNLNVSFLRAGRAGEAVRQEAAVVKAGRRLSVIVTEAFAPDGAMLAHATLTYAMPVR